MDSVSGSAAPDFMPAQQARRIRKKASLQSFSVYHICLEK